MRVRALLVLGSLFLLFGLYVAYQRVLEHLNATETAVERIIEDKEFVWANFTDEERTWLSRNYTVSVGADKNFYPIEGIDAAGNYSGVASDYLRILEKLTGLQFSISTMANWPETLTAVQEGRVDMLAALAPSSNRSRYLRFTSPYIAMPGIIVVQRGRTANLRLEDLAGKTVSVVRRYVWHDYLEEHFRDIKLDIVEDNLTGLQHVSFGQSDAMVDFQFSITHRINQSGILNLQVGGAIETYPGIAMGVSKEHTVLLGIINKALKQITPEEHKAISGKWLKIVEEGPISDRSIAIMVTGLMAMLAATCFILLWNLSLKRIVEQQTGKLNDELKRRDLAEAALRKSEERYRRIFENIQDVYLQVAMDGQIIEISPSVRRVFAFAPEKAQQMRIRDVLGMEVLGAMSRVLRDTGELEDYSFVLCMNGVSMHCSVSGKYLRDAKGRPTEFVGSVRNVTSRVQYEEMLSKANLELESRVVERTRDLQCMNEALQRSKEEADAATTAKSRFLASISHELRTPLHAIIAFTEHVRSLETSPLVHKYLRNIQDASSTLLDIINDLLDFSKIEAGHVELGCVPFMLEHCVQRVCVQTLAHAAVKELEFVVDLPPAMPDRFMGDPVKLQQVIRNLVGNALKFTPPGGRVSLCFAWHAKHDHAVWLHCFVEDTGIGIAEDALPQLFVPFGQAAATQSHCHGGTGLGLSICRQFIEAMGGEIYVESEEGAGALFAFSVPILLQKGSFASSWDTKVYAGRSVLLVARSAYSAMAMKRHFDFAMCRAEVLHGVEAALAHLAEVGSMPDLICLGHNIIEDEHPERLFNIGNDHAVPVLMLVMQSDMAGVWRQTMPEHVHLFAEVMTQRMLHGALCAIFDPVSHTLPAGGEPKPAPGTGVFAGVHVLVAEDAATNRDIIRLLLEPTGARLTFAENGRKAVDAVKSASYDVILMDIQMPEMDGCAAANAIRGIPGAAQVPIIALTAHAIKGSHQQIHDAGMKFLLTKPFGKEELYAVMAEALNTTVATGYAGGDAAESEITRCAVLDVGAAERLGVSPGKLAGLRKQFAQEFSDTLSAVRSAYAERHYDALEKEAHGLAGAAANIGADACAHCAGSVEQYAGLLARGEGSEPVLEEMLGVLEQALGHAVEAIKSMPAQDAFAVQEVEIHAVPDTSGWASIPELIHALESSNPLKIEPLLAQVKPVLPSHIFGRLEVLVLEYEYAKAGEYLHTLEQAEGFREHVAYVRR